MESSSQQDRGALDRSHRIRSASLVDVRRDAAEIFTCSLERTRVAEAMKKFVSVANGAISLAGERYSTGSYDRLLLVAIGKAAGTMTSAFLDCADDAAAGVQGVVVAGGIQSGLPGGLRQFAGGHPSPTQASLDAGRAILSLLESAGERDLVVFLISGGGSSMVEQMLRSEITLGAVAETHKALVESGAPIAAINTIRKHLSAVKGGRLAAAAWPAQQVSLFLSDVPAGELDALASGPTLADRSTVEDVRRIVAEYDLAGRLPQTVAMLLLAKDLPETAKPGDPIFARSRWAVLLDSTSLEQTAAARARELGWKVTIDSSCDDWTAEAAARYLLRRLDELKAEDPGASLCLLSSGEVTVSVAANCKGRGGRNQHFVLLCTGTIAAAHGSAAEASTRRVVLSAGSDGIDGNSVAAGGTVDNLTWERAAAAGYPVERAIADFDSSGLLTLLGDAIITGPTGNNLRDLRILLAP